MLSDEESATLTRWSRRATSAHALALRSKIILRCADGADNITVASGLGVTSTTVGKWRRRFVEEGWTVWSTKLVQVVRGRSATSRSSRWWSTRWSAHRGDATHWSRSAMAAETGLSKSTVGRIWRAFGLKPHLVDTFKLSSDPLFIEKVRDVVGLYVNPPERAVVLCVDEKSGIQALNRSSPLLPMMPGTPERRTFDYARAGTTDLFAALDVATGLVIHSHPATTPRGRVQEVPVPDRSVRAGRTGCASDLRQPAPPIRPRRSAPGSPPTHDSICTSPRPAPRG